MSKIWTWFKDRLSEKGTRSVVIGGIVFLLARVGVDLDVESQSLLDTVIVGVTAFFVSVFKEKTVEH